MTFSMQECFYYYSVYRQGIALSVVVVLYMLYVFIVDI